MGFAGCLLVIGERGVALEREAEERRQLPLRARGCRDAEDEDSKKSQGL